MKDITRLCYASCDYSLYLNEESIVLAVGTYSIRALYFAVLKEANVPFALTGTAVGLISVVGHQYVYLMLVVFSVIGLIASLRFVRFTKKTP
ncbi:hypothetical protein N9C11_00250 [Flavobacteriaceae bacterium]|nr:hypothetical protein [Flavobacteriaceae bacterium]